MRMATNGKAAGTSPRIAAAQLYHPLSGPFPHRPQTDPGRTPGRKAKAPSVIARRRSRRSDPGPQAKGPGLLRSLRSRAMTGAGLLLASDGGETAPLRGLCIKRKAAGAAQYYEPVSARPSPRPALTYPRGTPGRKAKAPSVIARRHSRRSDPGRLAKGRGLLRSLRSLAMTGWGSCWPAMGARTSHPAACRLPHLLHPPV